MNPNYPTTADWASRVAPNGAMDHIVEMMIENRPVVRDIMFLEGNLPTGHQGTVRTGLPEPSFRRAYAGVPFTKSETQQVTSTCALMEDWSRVDEVIANLNGNRAAFRMKEDIAHVQGMWKKWSSTFWYGDQTTAPDEFTGLAPLYSDTSAYNGQNIIDMGGTGSGCCSVWLVTFGEDHVHGIYPNGQNGKFVMEDMGRVKAIDDAMFDGSDNSQSLRQYMAYETHFQMYTGLHLANWKTTVRLANIKVSELTAGAYDSIIGDALIEMYNQAEQTFIPSVAAGTRSFIYMPRVVKTRLDMLSQKRVFGTPTGSFAPTTPVGYNNPVNITPGEWAGRPASMFWDIPMQVDDTLLLNETAI